MKRIGWLILLFLVRPAAGLEVEPIYSFQLLGGQYFFQGERGSLSGNVSALAAPALVFNDHWTLLPSWTTRYQGTKQVVDLVGAGSIFQEQMNHRAAAKAIYKPEPDSRWRHKPSVAYSMELLKETNDETWFNGLFDYRMLDLGYEVEYFYKEPFSLRAGVDLVTAEFPNYTSLESKAAFDFQGESLARELVGDQVLNTRVMMLTLAGTASLSPRWIADARLVVSRQSFPNQRIVDGTGLLTGEDRLDFVTSLDVSAKTAIEWTPSVRMNVGAGIGFSNTASNQNNYDARRTEFQSGYYDMYEFRFGPNARLLFGDERQPITLSMAASLTHRRYPRRRIQDAAGTYQSRSLRQTNWMLSTTLNYPMAPRLSLLFNFQHGRAASNQGFEQFYSYNYSATNYLMGFRYDY